MPRPRRGFSPTTKSSSNTTKRPPLGCGWIKRGQAQPIPTHSGRRRLNLNGTIELGRLQPLAHFGERIDADATIALLQRIKQAHFSAAWIFVICDNARYY